MLQENLRALRKARGLSQEDLAQRLHITRQTLSKWENGLSVPVGQNQPAAVSAEGNAGNLPG